MIANSSLSPEEQAAIDTILRDELDQLADSTSSNNADKVLHIPHHPQCQFTSLCMAEKYAPDLEMDLKGLDTYPSGWRPWCNNCITIWKEEKEGYQDA